jgi:hypothetical protein
MKPVLTFSDFRSPNRNEWQINACSVSRIYNKDGKFIGYCGSMPNTLATVFKTMPSAFMAVDSLDGQVFGPSNFKKVKVTKEMVKNNVAYIWPKDKDIPKGITVNKL